MIYHVIKSVWCGYSSDFKVGELLTKTNDLNEAFKEAETYNDQKIKFNNCSCRVEVKEIEQGD